ncbi:VanZ family protein [Halobacterium litoreum]|uniref:Antibiotic resistance protein VanZ n=1 Tax=Halobacterium litoreum TaxID=2039234 RepID=A0ABD5NDU4_9EURY|nr:hypothetical protein [Halobacterium litoreum]UHH13723.1 hypothetical protein LT972_01700 [Halobacterium litoreum]
MKAHRVAAAVALAAVVGASLLPASGAGGAASSLPAGADKLLHAAGYAVVAYAAASSVDGSAPRTLVLVALGVAAVGAGVELVQPAVGRHASALDALANLAGAVAGVALNALVADWTNGGLAD